MALLILINFANCIFVFLPVFSQTYTESQSSQYSTCAGSYANLNDGNLATIAGCNGGPGEFVKATFAAPQVVTAVSIGASASPTCGWGTMAPYLNGSPSGALIQSSPDDATWTTRATVSGAADGSTTTFSFAAVTAQYWRLYKPTGWLATSEFTFTFGSTDMVYSSGTTTQTNTSTVLKATTNNEVIGIQIVTTGTTNPLSATNFSLNTTGTTAPLTDITNAKLWSTGTSSTFATTTQFGATVAAPNGAFTITGTQTLSTGTNYFWLTYDVPAGATTGNVIDAQCASLTVGTPQTPTVTAPAGSRTIDGPMIYLSSTTTQNNTSPATVGFSNQEIIGIQIVTSGTISPLSVTNFSLNTTGTSAPLADIQNAKLWYTGTSNAFATTTQFGTTVAAPNGAFTFSGTQTLSSGTNYFWLSFDIQSGATINNVVDAQCTSLTVGTPQTPTVTAPAGSRTIIKSSAGLTAAGGNHSLAVCSDGTARAWGLDGNGQLGDNAALSDKLAPVTVSGLTGITMVAGGYQHSIALKNDATVWTWGLNGNGQLGDGTSGSPANDKATPVQANLTALGARTVTAIAAGSWHSLVLCSDGTVWAWGYNGTGQLGDGSITDRLTPVQVSGLTGIIAIAGGRQHSLALKNDNTMWSWGYNNRGQLGDNTLIDRWTPIQVHGTGDVGFLTSISAIGAGDWHSLAVKSDGTAWDWGLNSAGELGDGTSGSPANDKSTPVQVSGFTNAAAVAGGNGHSLALKTDGTVWSWGSNTSGQLGDNTTGSPANDKSTPVQVRGPGNVGFLAGITAIAGSRSQFHSMSLKNDNTVWGWGYNIAGQLGDSSTSSKTTPVKPISLCSVGPLPVELISFTARCTENKNVRLEWTTTSETNNDYFEIQRNDGMMEEWNIVGKIKGAGNSSTIRNYEFSDTELPTSGFQLPTLYYRLKQTDYDGKYDYSDITDVNRCSSADFWEFEIYPNPASEGKINAFISSEKDISIDVTITDVTGREVIRFLKFISKGYSEIKIDTHQLSPGMYLVNAGALAEDMLQKQLIIAVW